MLCRGLRQAAASAKQLSLVEQRVLASVFPSTSQTERFPTDQCKVFVTPSAQACQSLHTTTARGVPLWTSSPVTEPHSHTHLRGIGNKTDTADAAEAETAEATTSAAEEHAEAEEEPVDPKDQMIAEKEQQVADYKDKLVHVLADMENLRQRTNRQAEQSRSFAIQGFVKSLLDVADNLERASGSVTDQSLKGLTSDGQLLSAQQSSKLLNGLLEGVHLTDRILVQALKQNGVEKFSPLGQKFDPNMHSALFQIPDAEKEAGTVVVVTKSGYSLNGRVVRAAEVGVSTAPQ